MSSFKAFDLIPTIQSTLKTLGFDVPTEIQERAMPALLKGESVAGIAETGSGKTLTYAIPVLQILKRLEQAESSVTEAGQPRAVVMVPSSDLGEQVAKVFKIFTHETRLRVRTALGGTAMAIARKNVGGPFEILLATPGRIEQLMELGLLNLGDVRFLVLDEADQILDQGFLPAVKRIVRLCPDKRQLALFSATASNAIKELIAEMFSDTQVIETRGRHRLVSTLKTVNCQVINGKRFPVLQRILAEKVSGGTLLFSNTREQCDEIAAQLLENGYSCAIYRGDMDKIERRLNLKNFREGTISILISTDLAARGLDVENVDRVINYHLPREMKNYLHRAGRTARAGRPGTVINLVTDRDLNLIKRLESIGNVPG